LDVSSGTRTSYCQVNGVDLASDSAAVAASTIDFHRIGDTSAVNVQRFAHVMWGYAESPTDWFGVPEDFNPTAKYFNSPVFRSRGG
jgi:hypothetical protein